MQASKSHNKIKTSCFCYELSNAYTPCYNNSILENYP